MKLLVTSYQNIHLNRQEMDSDGLLFNHVYIATVKNVHNVVIKKIVLRVDRNEVIFYHIS